MAELFVEGARKFFEALKSHHDKKKMIYERFGFPSDATISFRDWEVLVAILMRDQFKEGNGCDLRRHEVKSARMGNSFEYQYHRNTGLKKLEEDQMVDHVFVSYTPDYEQVLIRKTSATSLKETFDEWKEKIIRSYQCESPKQRCRHSLSYGFVKSNSELIMEI